jgi:SAM-dependent methyltransferase
MSQDKLSEFYTDGRYSEHNPDWHAADAAWKAAQILQAIDSCNINFDQCTEVGCGTGLILEHLSAALPKKNYFGYDISPIAKQFWQNRKKTILFSQEDYVTSGKDTDLLLLIDVFEHVPDYIGFLRQLRKKTKWVIFHIPLDMHVSGLLRDMQIHTRTKVGHLHYFSRATALATLRDCGYEIVAERFTLLSQQTVEGKRLLTYPANVMRKTLQVLSQGLAAKLMGGYSLLVVCKTS